MEEKWHSEFLTLKIDGQVGINSLDRKKRKELKLAAEKAERSVSHGQCLGLRNLKWQEPLRKEMGVGRS